MSCFFVPDPETGYTDVPEPRGPQIPRDCVGCDRLLAENGGPIQVGERYLCRECAERSIAKPQMCEAAGRKEDAA